MLTAAQEKYLHKVSDVNRVVIRPWSSQAAQFAQNLIEKIHAAMPDLEILWSGALALGISGVNDIDLSILVDPEDFEVVLPKLIPILGEPQIKASDKILWRTSKGGHHVDAYMGSKNSDDIQLHKKLFVILRDDKNGLSLREYQKRKFEFYNRLLLRD